ncbi:hypothetical protein F4859DRAFT_519992 [Xylaria cf. heliscus]|nr:hypothetical protein F4859DRAFT_519992 [Xylaria cf. heliscus]
MESSEPSNNLHYGRTAETPRGSRPDSVGFVNSLMSPSSAFITYMLLLRKYKGNANPVLLNAAIKNDASERDNGYGRNQIVDDPNSLCDPSWPNKIILSTYRICQVP